ncbi:MAG: ribosomal protein S24E [Kiritimatiellia bacterium]|jgi:ribosomal protein S24E
MKNICVWLAFSFLAVFWAGCGSQDAGIDIDAAVIQAVKAQTGPMLARNQELEARVAQLERTNLRLDRTIEEMKASSTTNEVREMVKEFLDDEVQSLVVTKLDEKIGGAQEAGQMFANIWTQQMGAYEAQKEVEEEARREERRQEEEARREERNQERLVRLKDELQMNDDQTQRLSIAQATFRTSMQTAFQEMRDSGEFNRDAMREKMEGMRDMHNEIVGQFLAQDQLDAYVEKNQSSFGFGGPGGDRGRGGR